MKKTTYTILLSVLALFATAQPIGDARQTKVSTTAGGCSISGEGFTIKDVGKTVIIHQAGAQGDELTALITGYVSATTLQLNVPAANTVTNAVAWIGTDNTPVLQSQVSSNAAISFQTGKFLFSGKVVVASVDNFSIQGNGAELLWISANPNSYITGTQAQKDLFVVNYCNTVRFDRCVFRNIGQEQARTVTASEGMYWTTLNGVQVAYSRHFNKTANTGSAVYNTGSNRVSITNCEAYRVGCLYKTSDSPNGCRIKNNDIKGYGQVAIYPGYDSVCSDNWIDNSEAPALSADERQAGYGTSHTHYITGAMDRVIIENENVVGCKNVCIQFNTGSGLITDNAIVSNCSFVDCPGGWLFLGGNHARLKVTLSGINLLNCAGGIIDQQNCEAVFNNINFDNSTLSISRAKSLVVQGCRFRNLPQANNPAIYIFPKDGVSVSVRGCEFSSTVDRSIIVYGTSATVGNIIVSGCTFNSATIAIGYNGVVPVAGSLRKIHVVGNDFFGEAIAAFYAVDCQGNRFHLSESIYSLSAAMQSGDVWDISNNTFIQEGFPYCLNISGAATQMVSIIRNDFCVGANIGYGGKAFFQNTENLFRQ